MKKSYLRQIIREEIKASLKEELSLKVGESVMYQGRKAIFKRHGHPGKTAHIEVDDEYIEVPVSKLKKDQEYDYTKASSHAVKKI